MRERQNTASRVINPPLFFFFQLLSTIAVTSYSPFEHFSVNCGSSGNVRTIDQRNWTGDTGSTLFSLVDPAKATQSIKPEAQVRSNRQIPYDTARLSRSRFSYSFAVTDGQKFIRLYFYPSSYNPNFLHTDAFFSVKAGHHTLLKDFNASLNADAGTSPNVAEPEGTIVREYCVNVDPGQRLNITFTPSTSHPNAYAFVSGIEVVSMPTFLYYTNPDNLQVMKLDGGNQQFPVWNSTALETVYRTNVGGSQIPPDKDTGMFRYWDNDTPYLKREYSYSVSAGFDLKLIYKDDQNYFAPDQMYETARNYRMKETSKFNVTWEFKVDSQFQYMVRLHFCEFDKNIEKVGDRVFEIFINDALVEFDADVMSWTQSQRLVPIHKDYVASMMRDESLSIKLQPHPTGRSTYKDVLLNGIEILKISDLRNNLGGPKPNPDLDQSLPRNLKASKMRVISTVVGSTSGFLLLILIVLMTYFRLARPAINRANSQWELDLVSKSKTSKSPPLPSDLCRCFSISQVKAATNNFNDSLIIGVGGFGNVYKGHIDNSLVPVAIKRLKQGSQQGLKEFQTEIEMLSQLRHHHLVSLIGYCNDDNEMILVYEFMARGTFREHLYDSENQQISWNQRLEICLGAARGLHYLHTGAKHAIIHRDVKSTNILIDENWMAKISDFGLSKIGPAGISRSNINVSTAVKGSIGYLDPEYYMCQSLTEKSDVYSFGVVLLEVLCGRPPILRAVERPQQNLVEWFRRCVAEDETYDTVDPLIRESITPECLKAFKEIALQCLADDGNERPSLGDVMLGLESMVETRHKTEKKKLGGTSFDEVIDIQ